MANVQFSLRLDAELKTKLQAEAKQLNRTESFVAATAIKNYLSVCEEKRSAIEDAIKLANQGHFISSKNMSTWVDSWGSEHVLEPPEVDTVIKP